MVDFVADATCCPDCSGPLKVQKTRRRKVVTLAHGAFTAREIVRACHAPVHARPRLVRSSALAELTPSQQRYGWDLIVHVGLERFVHFRQRSEIRQRLRLHYGIEVSTGTVSALADRFVRHLRALHVERVAQLRAAIEADGGYSLHIDSTNETGRGGLFVCLDGRRGWVLNSGTISTERYELIEPIISQTVAWFGTPLATVRDMSKACKKAVSSLRARGVPDLVCHFHFLADIGKDLLTRCHQRLKRSLRIAQVHQKLWAILREVQSIQSAEPADGRCAELAALVYWVLRDDGKRPARFPFSLAHLNLYDRLQWATDQAQRWVTRPWSQPVERTVETLEVMASKLAADELTRQLVDQLRLRWRLFDELRQILRLQADPAQWPQQPLLPAAEAELRERSRTELRRFEQKLEQLVPTPRPSSDGSPSRLILAHLNRYRDHLFGHPVVRAPDGRVIFVVDRTNNPLELRLSLCKQKIRRRTGRRHLARDLEDLPHHALLAENLRDSRYVQILCGSLDNLPDAIARTPRTATATPLRQRPHSHLQAQVKMLRSSSDPLCATAT